VITAPFEWPRFRSTRHAHRWRYGRDQPQQLFNTSGTDSEVAARGSYSLSVGGSRPNSTDWLLDGVDNNELTAGGIGIFSSIDDIQEFKVLTYTYSAEYGSRAGPTVLVTTKSGTT
jgi:hypothetical protein